VVRNWVAWGIDKSYIDWYIWYNVFLGSEVMDRIYKVVIQGFIIQKDYMEHPDNWDWTRPQDFELSEVTITELKEEGGEE